LERLEDRCVLDGSFGPWGAPINLGSDVNSTASDQHPAISKDGLSLYITSNRPGGQGGDDIWVSRRSSVDSPWGVPVNLDTTINTASNDRVPTFSRDGHWMFFGSTRPGGVGGLDLWASYREHVHDDFGWQTPINLADVNSSQDDDGPTLFTDEETGATTLYFTSRRPGGPGDFDIYSSIWDASGSFAPPILVAELSGSARDTRTAIRHDGLELFLTSDRAGSVLAPDGVTSSIDIWVSTRPTTQSPWSQPVNLNDLGSAINTPYADGAPAISSDSQTLYFYSNRPGGAGGNDLYAITRAKNVGSASLSALVVIFDLESPPGKKRR
jgi:hypothetical protein